VRVGVVEKRQQPQALLARSAIHGLRAQPLFNHLRVRKVPVDPSTGLARLLFGTLARGSPTSLSVLEI
jgi:hypothetical protein